MKVSDATIMKHRLAMESMRAYAGKVSQQLAAGKIDDALIADIQSTLALAGAQCESACQAMDAEDPEFAKEVAVAAEKAGITLYGDKA